jgi:3-hydroxyacyl-[acyl-carrier-protein] dehydratase
MDIQDIIATIPHRYPFLLIDRILEMKEGEYIIAVKNVTVNEPFFQGHFPGNPMMPGVLIIEGMAQAGTYLALKSDKDAPGKKLALFGGIEKARFKRSVVPGDVLRYEVKKSRCRGRIWWLECKATVEGEIACKAVITAVLTVEKE